MRELDVPGLTSIKYPISVNAATLCAIDLNTMNEQQTRLNNILLSFLDVEEKIIPATQDQLNNFTQIALAKGVPPEVIKELTEVFEVSNGVPCIDSFDLHECGDIIIFEWWDEQNVLWLGGRDMDVYRWVDNKFCIGDASDDSYSAEYEFKTFINLIAFALEEFS